MKAETVIGVLLRFLEGKEARAKASLISRKGESGRLVLSSYGVPVAELRDGEVVVKVVGSDDKIPVRMKHMRWLEVIAQEKGFSVEHEGY